MQSNEREFFTTVRKAIFANPFGEARLRHDLRATGMTTATSLPEILSSLVEKVGKTLQDVEKNEHQFDSEETELLRYGKLFYTFHLFCKDIDEHILAQVDKGDACCQVKFAEGFLGMLNRFGFNEAEATRFLELSFQMRRAYFFIRSIAGSSECVRQLRSSLWNNIFTGDIQMYDRFLWNRMEDFSTMILGETGTGKGVSAAAIGRSNFIPFNRKTGKFSESFTRAFTSINLSQFPEQLIESELFGHKKGSFTGAIQSHQGVLALCSPCGAIFLDEIGDVSIPVQIKLLQVLQSRTFTPVGSHTAEQFQGRIIAATNKDLDRLRESGEFRDDFYYRLCSDVIEVPPLRIRIAQNPGELQELLAVVVERIVGRPSEELTAQLYTTIKSNMPEAYHWPGNIRELEQCARRMLLNNHYSWQHKRQERDSSTENLLAGLADKEMSAQHLLAEYCGQIYKRYGTYEAVSRITRLDRRTAKKYVKIQ